MDLGQGEDPDKGRCLGIRCNIWARAAVPRGGVRSPTIFEEGVTTKLAGGR